MIVDEDGNDGFHRCDSIEEFEEFILSGYQPNSMNLCEETPLFHRNNPEIVRRLINMGLDVNHRNINGNTPLFSARSLEVAMLLIGNGADINAVNNYGETALFRCGNANVANYLIMNGLDVNARNSHNETPLMTNFNADVMKVLIENGADVNAVGGWDCHTALHTHDEEKQMRILLDANADIELRDNLGRTPLFYKYTIETAKLLLDHNANIDVADNEGIYLIEAVRDEVCDFILEYLGICQ